MTVTNASITNWAAYGNVQNQYVSQNNVGIANNAVFYANTSGSYGSIGNINADGVVIDTTTMSNPASVTIVVNGIQSDIPVGTVRRIPLPPSAQLYMGLSGSWPVIPGPFTNIQGLRYTFFAGFDPIPDVYDIHAALIGIGANLGTVTVSPDTIAGAGSPDNGPYTSGGIIRGDNAVGPFALGTVNFNQQDRQGSTWVRPGPQVVTLSSTSYATFSNQPVLGLPGAGLAYLIDTIDLSLPYINTIGAGISSILETLYITTVGTNLINFYWTSFAASGAAITPIITPYKQFIFPKGFLMPTNTGLSAQSQNQTNASAAGQANVIINVFGSIVTV